MAGLRQLIPTTGRTHGLGNQSANWRDQALCGQREIDGVRVDPEWWNLDNGNPAAANAAISICGRCPVRKECLDEALADRPRGMVAGGWQFRTTGKTIPYAGDKERAPVTAPRVTVRAGASNVERARLSVAAGRRCAAGGNTKVIAETFQLKPDTVRALARFVRLADAATLVAVEDGEISLSEAMRRTFKWGAR
jgi:hypothetical protein